MSKRKKRFSVKKWIRSKGKRAQTEESTGSPGFESGKPEADKTASFFDPSDTTSHAYCDEPAPSVEEVGDIERGGVRTQSIDTV